jgi:hypothetical protein
MYDTFFGSLLTTACFLIMAVIVLKSVFVLIPGAIAGGLCIILGLAYRTRWHFAFWLPIVAGGSSLILALWSALGLMWLKQRHTPGEGFSGDYVLLIAAGFVGAILCWPIAFGLFTRPRWKEIARHVMTTGLVVYAIMAIATFAGFLVAIK